MGRLAAGAARANTLFARIFTENRFPLF